MFQMQLKLSSLVFCGVFALLINFLSITVSPFLDQFRFVVLGVMILVATAVATTYNSYMIRRRAKARAEGEEPLSFLEMLKSLYSSFKERREARKLAAERAAALVANNAITANADEMAPVPEAASLLADDNPAEGTDDRVSGEADAIISEQELAAAADVLESEIAEMPVSEPQPEPVSESAFFFKKDGEEPVGPVFAETQEPESEEAAFVAEPVEEAPVTTEPASEPVVEEATPETAVEAETQSAEDSEASIETDVVEEPEPDIKAEAEIEAEPVSEDTEETAKTEVNPVSEDTEAVAEAEAEPVSEDTEAVAEAGAEPVSEDTEAVAETEAEPVSEDTEAVVEAEGEPVSEGTEAMAEAEAEPVSEDTEAVAEAEAEEEQISESEPEDVIEPESENVAAPVIDTEVDEKLTGMDNLDDMLDYAFELKDTAHWTKALQAYEYVLDKYPDDTCAPMLVIEISNMQKDNGHYQEAIKSFKKALSIPTVAENPDMVTEFEDSILYLETVYSVIQEENLGEIPFYDIPQEYMSKIESIYNNRKSR
ncbi:hypothetical protein [Anaerovibrio sp.]|uniref:tetratricopeptide repeat protein n=1 Tax=Anaerovibrio sp. TaxID=1872532 RepID=UPI0025B8B620|nr:hypothetical protein [Anaerovibrio sp.]